VQVVGGVFYPIRPNHVVNFAIENLKRLMCKRGKVFLINWKVKNVLSEKIKKHNQASL
jgi:hypothetical protein